MADPTTLPGALLHAAEVAAPRDGLIFLDGRERETRYTWAAIAQRALSTATALREAGVQPGDRVGIILPTGVEFMDAFFGAGLLGAVPVPLYPPVRLGRLDEYYDRTAMMLRTVEASAIVSDGRVRRLLGQVVARYKPPCGLLSAEELHRRQTMTVDSHSPRPDGLAMVQFSSGTTVDPKAVALSHRAVLANTAAILKHIPHRPEDEAGGVSWLPLYHDMGLIGCVFVALVGPGPLTLIPPEQFLVKPALWLRALARTRATASPAPNFAYALCVDRVKDSDLDDVDGQGTRADLSRWRLALNGAEPVAPGTLRAFQERFAAWGLRPDALRPVYGLSEAALAVTFSPAGRPFHTTRFAREPLSRGQALPAADGLELVSVGVPLDGYAVQIRGESGVCADGTIGRVWIAGPSLMEGYLGRTDQPLVDGWLDTGDLGVIWQGELYLTGRAKDVIILRGRNHAPHDIEHAVDTVEGVRVGCAAAVAELSEEGERLLVFVEVREPLPDLAESCRQAVLAATGLDPSLVVLLEPGTLPRTSSGKIRRGETLVRWRAGALTPPEKVGPWLLAGALAKSALGYLTSR